MLVASYVMRYRYTQSCCRLLAPIGTTQMNAFTDSPLELYMLRTDDRPVNMIILVLLNPTVVNKAMKKFTNSGI